MPRSASDRLRRAEKGGAKIETKDGTPVKYDSRHSRDDKPWKTSDGDRLSGPECKPVVKP